MDDIYLECQSNIIDTLQTGDVMKLMSLIPEMTMDRANDCINYWQQLDNANRAMGGTSEEIIFQMNDIVNGLASEIQEKSKTM